MNMKCVDENFKNVLTGIYSWNSNEIPSKIEIDTNRVTF